MVGYDPSNKEVELPELTFGVAGALSGFVTRAICQPLDVLKIRLQVREVGKSSFETHICFF